MSNEVKEKVNLEPKYILTLTLTLLITCVVVAGVLGWVNQITKGPIDDFNRQKTEQALKDVVADPQNSTFPELGITPAMTDAAAAYGATLSEAYTVTVSGQNAGVAFKVTASGSQGNIEMIVGVDADGAVSGVSIVKNAETSGIGSKVMDNELLASGVPVLDQFDGRTAAEQPLKVGGNVDAISGATVSTKGVTKGVNGALAAAAAVG